MLERVLESHRNNRLLAALPVDTFEAMVDDLCHVSIPQGELIFERGDDIAEVYFPQTGMISLLVVNKNGGAIEAATVGREGALGLHRGLGARRSFTRATAQIGGKFSTIRAVQFERIVHDHAPLRDMIGRYIELTLAEAQQTAACNATHDAASRLARWLLQCADRTGSDRLPLTLEFLAQMLGVRRTTVTLLAQTLQRKGLIKYTRGQIALLDRNALEKNACECYPVIRHDRLPLTLGMKG